MEHLAMARKVAISSGHGLYVRGASGSPVPPQLDEVNEARKVVDRVAQLLGCVKFHDNSSTSQSANLNAITNWHNKQSRDLDVSVHFNAYDHSAHGVEVLYVTQQSLAAELSAEIAEVGQFTNRGAKKRTDLAFLNNTNKPAILVETCFCDNTGDSNKYNQYFESICQSIAEIIGDTMIEEPPEEIIDPEPPDPEEPGTDQLTGTVHGLAAGDVLNIRASSSSSSPIIGRAVNGDLVTVIGSAMNGSTQWYKLQFGDDHMAGVAVYGWAAASYIQVDGEPPESGAQWHTDITATEFGGSGDDQDSAYPDIDWINSSSKGIALPYKWSGTRPRVTIRGPSGETTCDIIDLGPWNLDDDMYVLNGERPLVETQYEDGTEAQNGMVPSNDAAIDLTPPIAKAVGISGKGKVSWRFT
jgi:N-acetylmuramoyl-L-alanine amidase